MNTVADRLRRLPLARATQVALASTIVLTVCGSSGVADVTRVGSKLRWVALAALLVFALAWLLVESDAALRPTPAHMLVFGLCALALASTAWSVAPRLTFERAVSFIVAVSAAAATAAAAGGVRDRRAFVGEGIVAAAAIVALIGIVVYLVDPSAGAQSAVADTPFRFRGLGESANTVPMLLAVATPIVLWLACTAGRRRRLVYGLLIAGFAVDIVLSGSRSALVGAGLAFVAFALVFPTSTRRRRAALVAAALAAGALLVAGVVGMVSLTALPPATPAPPGTAPVRPLPYPRVVLGNLEDELGSIPSGRRTLLGRDGRTQALQEAIDQANQRPALGWGFGTEEKVFIDRLAQFHAARPENSYVGLYLQLGAVGLALFVALAGFLGVATARTRRLDRERRVAAAGLAGAVAAGYGLAFGQSYVYAVGNVATLSVFCAVFLLAGLVERPLSRRVAVACGLACVVVAAFAVPLGRTEGSSALDAQRRGIQAIWTRIGGRVDSASLDGFRRLASESSCLLYGDKATPTAYEVCFDRGRAWQAIDRRAGGFHAWTIQPFGVQSASLVVDASSVDSALHVLHAFGKGIGVGPGFLARPPRG